MSEQKCPVCLHTAESIRSEGLRDADRVSCRTCGTFVITRPAALGLDHETDGGAKRYILSAAVREFYDKGSPIELSTYSLPEILASFRIPEGPLDAIDRLLLWLHDRTDSPSDYVILDRNRDYSVVVGRDSTDLSYYLQKAKALGYVEQPAGDKVRLDLKGWERVAELRRRRTIGNQAFVAMWFDPSMTTPWEEGIRPALVEAEYDPIRVDLIEHNDKIDDLIIAEIRRSALVVADFTGHRGGVYFEAGFAMGLGIPVVRTCRDTNIDDTHFDTRQYNHVVWMDPTDLKKKLERRIAATILR